MRTFPIILAVALSGCVSGPNYRTPTIPQRATGDLPYVPSGSASKADVPDRWWTLYDDPALNDFVERALVANTDLRQANANLDVARAALRASRSYRLPQTVVGASAVYGRSATESQISGALDRKAPNGLAEQFDGQMSFDLDVSGRIKRSIEAAAAQSEAAAADRDAVRIGIIAETVRAYVAACSASNQATVARASAGLAADQERIVSSQLTAGGVPRYDLVRTATLAVQAAAAVPAFDGKRQAALFALAAMIGTTPDDVPVSAAACVRVPRVKGPISVGDGAALMRRRPDLRAAERNLAAASARIGVAEADLYPRISLTGSVASTGTAASAIGSRSATVFGFGPLISWSFPNLATVRAQIESAKATDRAALAKFDGIVLTALREVEQSLARYAASVDRQVLLEAAATNADEAFTLSQKRLAAGAASRLDVLTSERTAIEARAAQAEGEGDLADLQITLFKSLGGGWASSPAERQ